MCRVYDIPEAVISIAVEPKTQADLAKMDNGRLVG